MTNSYDFTERKSKLSVDSLTEQFMTGVELVNAAKTAKTLSAFVEEGGFSTALRAVGDANMRAAEKIISELNSFANTKDAMNRALGQLEVAHEAFRERWLSDKLFQMFGTEQTALKDVWVCCLIAVCHKYLKNKSLVSNILQEGQEALNRVYGSNISNTRYILELANPKFYYDNFRDNSQIKRIKQKEFEEFCCRISSSGGRWKLMYQHGSELNNIIGNKSWYKKLLRSRIFLPVTFIIVAAFVVALFLNPELFNSLITLINDRF